ncbi:MAG TPA: TetR/AcrR family transcriptional regulator, partial [Mycobacterium sp.]
MTTSRQRNARGEGGRLRQDIIDAAIRLIDKSGSCESMSLRAVAKEAGIAAPSVYPHFADRDALLLAILEQLFDEVIAIRTKAEEAAAAAGGGPWEQLRAAEFAMVDYGLQRPGHYKMLHEGRVISGLTEPRRASFGRPMQVRVAALIRAILAGDPS